MAQLSTAKLNYRVEIEPDSLSGAPVTEAKRAYATAKSGLEAANIAVDRARLALEHVSVRAPYDGVIEKVTVAEGDRISSGADVAVIVDLTNLRVEAQVLEHDIPLVRVGGDAQVTVAAMPDKLFHGTIAAVLPLVDSVTRAGRAAIRLKGDGTLRPGMYADIRLEANRLPNRIIVPAKAVIERDSRPLVFVVRDGRAEWVYINPGRTNTRETEVLPDSATGEIPLKAGDIVLTEGHLTLSHQAPVRLTEKRETGQTNN
jgi:HlyD family secretion protein